MQLAANGEAGRAWLADLPRLIDELQQVWSIREIGVAYQGGCVAYVAPVVLADGSRAALKINLVDEETECEADALAAWNGNGAARLLESDQARGAMLLERLEPGAALSEYPDRDEAIGIACSLLRRLWKPAPDAHRFRLVTHLAQHYAQDLPAKYVKAGRPFEEGLLKRAVEFCHEFARSESACVIANRDFHLGNVLAAEREPWLVIDPKPLAGEPAFDTGHLVRSLLPERIDARETARLITTIAERLELPARRVAEWIVVRSVDNALWAISTGRGDYRWDVACAEAAQRMFHLL